MAIRPILFWPDPRLAEMCAPVARDDATLPALIEDLFHTLYAAKGRGLAAPQIGVLSRVFVVDVTWKETAPTPQAFVNPTVVATSDTTWDAQEQCLSIPDLPMTVTRSEWIDLRWTSPEGAAREARFHGVEARCIQHEFDHLNGRVILDHQAPGARRDLEAAYAG